MAYRLFLTVRPTPAEDNVAALRHYLEKAFSHKDNSAYFDALFPGSGRASLSRAAAQRLGALSLLPSLLEAAGIDSNPLVLRRDEHGRPFCTAPDGSPVGFDFNLSHSSAHIAGALLVGSGTVGVDVEEWIPPKRAWPLIRRFCTEGELAMLENLPDDDDLAARFFTSTWVEREAIAKQEGGGMPLRFDTASLPPNIMLWSGYLADSGTGVALCAPLQNAPAVPRILADSLPLVLS